MNLRKISTISIAAGLLSPACGFIFATSSGAEAPAPAAVTSSPVKQISPEVDAAGHRVDQAKIKLDQARNQLGAAKAMLKAAEAEFKAARADKDALAARSTAQQLADASGLKDDGVSPVQPTAAMTFGANRLYPAPVTTTTKTTSADLAKTTRIQQTDFNSPAKDDQAEGVKADSSAAPSLRPAAAEPQQPLTP